MNNADAYLLRCRHVGCSYTTFETLKLMQHSEQHDRRPAAQKTTHTEARRATNAKRRRPMVEPRTKGNGG